MAEGCLVNKEALGLSVDAPYGAHTVRCMLVNPQRVCVFISGSRVAACELLMIVSGAGRDTLSLLLSGLL